MGFSRGIAGLGVGINGDPAKYQPVLLVLMLRTTSHRGLIRTLICRLIASHSHRITVCALQSPPIQRIATAVDKTQAIVQAIMIQFRQATLAIALA